MLRHTAICVLLSSITLAGCAHRGGRDVALSTSEPKSSTVSVTSGMAPGDFERAHRLIITTTACWFGGTWNDAIGDSKTAPIDRCADVLSNVYSRVDKDRLERLRASEAVEVRELEARVRTIAQADPIDKRRVEPLMTMFRAVAAAQHEEMLARRAAERVKMDTSGERDRDRRTADERAGDYDLEASTALNKLLTLDAAELSPEAQAVGLMIATDRMQIAIGLPKHLKVDATKGAFQTIFGVPPPAEPADPAKKLAGGEWLTYLSDVAKAAGHPVPVQATKLTDREMMAWGGTLEGLSDRLRVDGDRIARNELKRAVDGVVIRLDNEYRASQGAVLGIGHAS